MNNDPNKDDDPNKSESRHLTEDQEYSADLPAPGRSVFGEDDSSFTEDDDAVPHWRDPATGSVPMVGAQATGSFDPAPEPTLIEDDPDDLVAWSTLADGPAWSAASLEGPAPPGVDTADEFFGFDDASPPGGHPRTDPIGAPPGVARTSRPERNMGVAAVVGLGLAVLILAAMYIDPLAALGVVVIGLGLASAEFFNAVRIAGYQPAVLVGIAGTVVMPVAVYWRGPEAMLLGLLLVLVCGSLWYLIGVSNGALRGLGATMVGFVQIGLLGSFAALMLDVPTHGTGLFTVAIFLTVAYDAGAMIIGGVMGRTQISTASPNKTVEGLIGGMAVVIGTAIIMGGLGNPAPLADSTTGGGMGVMIMLGVAVAVVAPIGDLAESLIKRDLGIKDMGSILPGHGGIFDRIDAMLFVMPTTWYVAQAVLT